MANSHGNLTNPVRFTVRFLTWNIKGMGNPIKRSKIFSHLKRLNTDIAFLQETHLRNQDHLKLKCTWVGDVFHSNFNSKSRGVAIVINKRVQFSSTKVIGDKNGRYLIVVGTILQNPVILVNVYAPNFDDPGFVNKLFEILPSLNSHLLIFAGEINCVIDPVMDRSCSRTITPSSMSRSIVEFMSKNGCIDPWRFYNSTCKHISHIPV